MADTLSREDRQHLLAFARETINAYVTTKAVPPLPTVSPALQEQRGCFVTIKKNGELRGCIGTFISDTPLIQTVREMAISAATRDPRFYPMKQIDIADYQVEISILSPLLRIDSVEEINVGEHGLYIEKGMARGVLLPQVATEHGWDREAFLKQTCLKAGLRPDDWRDGAEISIFGAEIISSN